MARPTVETIRLPITVKTSPRKKEETPPFKKAVLLKALGGQPRITQGNAETQLPTYLEGKKMYLNTSTKPLLLRLT
ncbi:hypothetical protein A2U01_0073295, partial [Trifolium medium]|nr:hypothetical protein [Trifolium medium]